MTYLGDGVVICALITRGFAGIALCTTGVGRPDVTGCGV